MAKLYQKINGEAVPLGGGGGGGSVAIDNVTITKNSDDEIQVADDITEKLSEIEDKATTVDEIKDATAATDKLVSAYAVQKFANRYTERFTFIIEEGETVFGEWQDSDPSEWEIDEEHFLFAEELYEADDEEIELTFLFDSSCNEPIYLGGYQYVSQHVSDDGKNVGCLCVKLGNTPSTNVTIAVDVTHLHRERNDYRG